MRGMANFKMAREGAPMVILLAWFSGGIVPCVIIKSCEKRYLLKRGRELPPALHHDTKVQISIQSATKAHVFWQKYVEVLLFFCIFALAVY